MHDDYKNIHFFQCEMNICIEKLEKEKKKNENLAEINYVIISLPTFRLKGGKKL